jgi:hypothetical protein
VATLSVECLRCGELRELARQPQHHLGSGECPRCSYVGWARSGDLTELVRRTLRERPVESRRLRVLT